MKKASLKRVPVIDSFAKTNGVGQDFRDLNYELVEKLGLKNENRYNNQRGILI